MIHPRTEVRFIDEFVGHGVFATEFIPRGTVTWAKDRLDRAFSPEEFEQFDEFHREVVLQYSYRDAKGHYFFCWDHARFMNHSFTPNCLPTAHGFEIAVRDIPPGTELTNDYGCFNIIAAFTPIDEGHSRKTVEPDDLLRFSTEWDDLIARAIVDFPGVAQPLAPLLAGDTRRRIDAAASGQSGLDSVAALYFPAS